MICKYRTLFLAWFLFFLLLRFFFPLNFKFLNNPVHTAQSLHYLLYRVLVTVRYFSGEREIFVLPFGLSSLGLHCTVLYWILSCVSSRLIWSHPHTLSASSSFDLKKQNQKKKTIGYFAIWGCVLCTVLAIFDTRKEIERLYI